VIGERDGVDPELLALIDEAKELTRNNTRLTLVIAFNYGGRNEIVRAAGRLAEEVAAGRLDPTEIGTKEFERALDTYGIPEPDLLIRTGGEKRLSNFLLWQSAYAEFVFLDTYWPDFSREDLAAAISEYLGRERRYGGLASRSTA
jgi:undecaprenyl diphosphate synthase